MTTIFRKDCCDLLVRLNGLADFTDCDAERHQHRDPQLAQALRDHSAQTRRLMAYIEGRCELEREDSAYGPVWRELTGGRP